jgi:arylsulfatase A-like enzyme
MRSFPALLAALLTLAEPPALRPAEAGRPARPNVVVLLADDLRADVLSTYGGPVKAPHLDRLARRGVVFRRATCGYPICHVSRTELLTGRFLVKEASAGKAVPFDRGWVTWPEAMREAGWHTVHCGKWHVQGTPRARGYAATAALFSAGGAKGLPLSHPRSATGRAVTGYAGWTFKTDEGKPLPELGVGLTPETDARIADGAVAAITGMKPGRLLFLHVHFTAPHDPLHWPRGREGRFRPDDVKLLANFRAKHPFDHGNICGRDETIVPAPRSEQDVRREVAVYYALVESLDVQVGRIVKAMEDRKELGRTVLVFSSDHGLALGSHGLMGKQNQYEHTANVPLVLTGPGVPEGKRLDAQCALRDLYATVCELAGLAVPASVQGKSLVPVLEGKRAEVHEAVFGYFTDTQRMMRTADGWKLISYPLAERVQLFHVAEDPGELRDLSAEPAHQARLRQMTRTLASWLRDRGDVPAGK